MKKLFIVLIIGWIAYACSEEEVGVYSLDHDYIYFEYDANTMSAAKSEAMDNEYFYYNLSSVSVNSTRQRDTFVYRVLVAGIGRDYDRKINIEPYVYTMPNTVEAVSGINYVAFDDAEMEKYLVVPADSVGLNIPIIVTYDQAIAGSYKNFTVGIKLVDSEDFKVMETNPILQSNPARSHACVRFTQSN